MNGVTIRDVARAADVSVATVSRTLNGIDSVALTTRDRVLRIVGELDYVPNSGARALSTRRTETIGVLLPDLHGEFFSELIRGIDLAAAECQRRGSLASDAARDADRTAGPGDEAERDLRQRDACVRSGDDCAREV